MNSLVMVSYGIWFFVLTHPDPSLKRTNYKIVRIVFAESKRSQVLSTYNGICKPLRSDHPRLNYDVLYP